MTEEAKTDKQHTENKEAEHTEEPKNTKSAGSKDYSVPGERFKEVVEEKNALKERLRELEDKEAQRTKAEEERKAQALKEQEKFKELAEGFEERLKELEPSLTAVQEERDKLESALKKYSEKLTENLPAHIKELVSRLPVVEQVEWFTKNSDQLSSNKPSGVPQTPKGTGSGEVGIEEILKKAGRTF